MSTMVMVDTVPLTESPFRAEYPDVSEYDMHAYDDGFKAGRRLAVKWWHTGVPSLEETLSPFMRVRGPVDGLVVDKCIAAWIESGHDNSQRRLFADGFGNGIRWHIREHALIGGCIYCEVTL